MSELTPEEHSQAAWTHVKWCPQCRRQLSEWLHHHLGHHAEPLMADATSDDRWLPCGDMLSRVVHLYRSCRWSES